MSADPSTHPRLRLATRGSALALVQSRIVADTKANRIIVTGTTDELQQINTLVQRLDAAPQQSEGTRVFQLNSVTASEMAKIVSEAMITYPPLERFPEVEDVRYGGEWVKRLDDIASAVQRGALVAGTLVALAIVFVMYNTLRLTVLARRHQVEIMSRLGATDQGGQACGQRRHRAQETSASCFHDLPLFKSGGFGRLTASQAAGPARSASRPTTSIDGEILVRFRRGAPTFARSVTHARAAAETIRTFDLVEGLELVRLRPGVSVQNALDRYRRDPDVLYAEPNQVVDDAASEVARHGEADALITAALRKDRGVDANQLTASVH